MNNIDNIAYIVLLLILIFSIFCPSELLGTGALLFSFLMVLKLIFKNSSYKPENYEKAVIVYFLFVTLSLCASTLFALSLHGYIKTFIYVLFFFCAGLFFKDNKNKIFPTILIVSILASIESIIAIIQNSSGVLEISGWQDMTNMNPEDIISRAYGTLKPYNPNLLAGYLLCTLSSFVYLVLRFIQNKNTNLAVLFCVLFLINLIAIVDTGCRGAYLGFLFFFGLLFFAICYYIKEKFGSFSNVKKRYKGLILASLLGSIFFVLSHPAIFKRIQSIFSLRADSSISFRFNVYQSTWHMFLDNPCLGIGVGNQNFREIYGLYMKSGFDALGSYCVMLEIAVESGIFALLAFVVFLIYAVKKCFKIYTDKQQNHDCKILVLCVALAVFAVMGHGLFDTIWFRPQVQLLFWTYIAMLKSV